MIQDQQTPVSSAWRGHTIHVFGALGAEGYAVLDWLMRQDDFNVVAHDTAERATAFFEWARVHEGHTAEEKKRCAELLDSSKITWLFAAAYVRQPEPEDIIFLPQSWFRYEINKFLEPYFFSNRAVRPEYLNKIWTLTRLYFTLFPGTLVAVTGSDGKTTTTSMIGAILRAHAAKLGISCFETGNDRTHAQSLADFENATPADFAVLEVSDRQLSFGFPFMPDVAVITNITQNKHWEDYGNFANYISAKANLIRWQNKNQVAVLNADDEVTCQQIFNMGQGQRHWFSLRVRPEVGTCLVGDELNLCSHQGNKPITTVKNLLVKGEHNISNVLAAAAATAAVGVPTETITQALENFSGVAHRLQTIRVWREIMFVEDSAGGNPINIAATLKTFSNQPLILLCGGYRPQLTDEELLPVFNALQERNGDLTVLLFGALGQTLKDKIARESPKTKTRVVETLANGIQWVRQESEVGGLPAKTVVCMTPGFESFDQFRDYRERAAHFVHLVNELP